MAERAGYWRDVLAQWRASGLTRAAFCRQRGISYHTLTYWKERLAHPPQARAVRREQPAGAQFVELAALVPRAHAPEAPRYEIVLANGRRLRLAGGFVEEEVARLLAMVEAC